MRVTTIGTSSLGDRSYLVDDGAVAAVVDPQRDIDRVLAAAGARGVRIALVLETHLHNDYVTGGLVLARATGAQYVLSRHEQVAFDRRGVDDGDTVEAGRLRLRVVRTPGHTHHHLSYVLLDDTGAPQAVFTGGSMLYGSTGRTDLLGAAHTRELTHAQYHSVRRLASELPDSVEVYPTHGFGSFCSATPTSGESSTVGQQRAANPALTKDEQTFVDELVAGLADYPAYYAHMGALNAAGPGLADLRAPEPVDPAAIRRRIDAGEWVVDLRRRRAFAAGHLAGSKGFELSTSFTTYLGWLYQWGAPVTLLGASAEQVLRARRDLARIGVDNVTGSAVGAAAELAAVPGQVRAYRVASFADLARELPNRTLAGRAPTVLDTRRANEYARGHVAGAVNIPLHELLPRRDEVPKGEVWVYCQSGYRAAVAASLLDADGAGGATVVLVDDAFGKAAELGLTGR